MNVCQGQRILAKIQSKKGHNSKNIIYRIMPLVIQLCLVMIQCKHVLVFLFLSKFSVDMFKKILSNGLH